MIALLALMAASPGSGFVLLHQGRYRQAIAAFHEELEARPGDPPLELGLARAQAASGRCSQASPLFARHRGEEPWTAPVALAAADCAELLGDGSLAAALVEEALLLSSEEELPDAAHALGALALRLRDPWLLEEARGAGFGEDPMARAQLAFARGDHDGVFEALAEQRARTPKALGADILEARVWLQLDDPGEALRALDPARGRRFLRPGVAPWLAEARRRLGQADHALTLADLKAHGPEPGPAMEAIRLRVRADLGQEVVREAQLLLERHPFHPEVVATAWYLSREPALAERYEQVRVSPAERLELALLPAQRELAASR